MAITRLQIVHGNAGDLHWAGSAPNRASFISSLINFIAGCASGAFNATSIERWTTGVQAQGTVTLASVGSGDVTATIGGTAVTVTYATSDANTATLLAAAINADETASKYVSAVKGTGATVVLTARDAGAIGNAIALTVAGTNVTADGSGFMGGTTAGSSDARVSLTF